MQPALCPVSRELPCQTACCSAPSCGSVLATGIPPGDLFSFLILPQAGKGSWETTGKAHARLALLSSVRSRGCSQQGHCEVMDSNLWPRLYIRSSSSLLPLLNPGPHGRFLSPRITEQHAGPSEHSSSSTRHRFCTPKRSS